MNLENRLEILSKLHDALQNMSADVLQSLAHKVEQNNSWFTSNNFYDALEGIKNLISEESLVDYIAKYSDLEDTSKVLGLILAGNIPAVGFHDVLIGLLSGANLKVKLSSEDKIFIPFLINELAKIDANFAMKCEFVEKLELKSLDAVIATGSDNTARYFEQYFSKLPNIIRKSRTSVAILRGNETLEQLKLLVEDITCYFGLGCRNVSKILLLGEVEIIPLLQCIEHKTILSSFSKYDNNYLYYKSIYLVNREPFLDTENMLFRETTDLNSPISVLFYQRFETEEAISEYIENNREKLQCVVGAERAIQFGKSQSPSILDYPDGIDIRTFIATL